ncbi:MAG: efflux RND transporter periplasmic adaptor subunit [Planctomycetota bacterium]|jgi:HlyD family secretion protein
MRPTVLIILLAVLGAGGLALVQSGAFATEENASLEGATVRRGPLTISVLEKGNLKAAKSVELRSEIEGRSTILWLIEEGTRVEPGELLCELDATALADRRVEQEIVVSNAESALVKAQQNLAIQESQNESDLAAARTQLEFAEQDLAKYVDGDYPQQLAAADESIELAREEYKRAEKTLQDSEELMAAGFYTQTEFEADQLNLKRSDIGVTQALRAKDLLEKYDNRRELLRLREAVKEAERGLDRVKLQAEARLVDFRADVAAAESKLGLEQETLSKIDDQVGKAKIYAPVAGMVVYAKEDGGRWRSGDPIAEGTEVRERQQLITIPAEDEGMVVETSVHESVLEQIAVGQPVEVRVDAIPGELFSGTVRYKAVLPDQNSWWANPDLRVYRTEVELSQTDERLRPGMTCSVEVLVAELDDAVHVPVQSIFVDGMQQIAFVRGAEQIEKRPVEVGQDNDVFVHVVAGLEAGETVLLSPPSGFELEQLSAEELFQAGNPDGAGGPPGGREGGSMGGAPMGGGSQGGMPANVGGGSTDWQEKAKAAGFDPSKYTGGGRPGGSGGKAPGGSSAGGPPASAAAGQGQASGAAPASAGATEGQPAQSSN